MHVIAGQNKTITKKYIIAGHDTTASGISWALYSLADNPEHMQKCQQEIDQLLEKKGEENIEWYGYSMRHPY